MRFHADLHIHSKYSRACSKDCDLEHLTWWARRKGITVVGTGDFTHPAWFDHLRQCLVPAEPGLFRLRDDLDAGIDRALAPTLAGRPVRFMLSVEISTIYKAGDITRKIHHLVYLPDFAAAERFNAQLGRIGNLGSDGRPILGLDSRDLLDITLASGDGGYLVPAHVWTPWFGALGSKSGFNRIADAYGDLAGEIFAIETGLSADPEMMWRVSDLDQYRVVSHSDAHSPPMLGREATVFDTDVDYFAIRRALATGEGLDSTVEFYPEEGKYHVDGHRKCDVRMDPQQTRELNGICPECAKPLTVGVLSRVAELADRAPGTRPAGAAGFRNLVPLPEIMSEILGVGPKSKRVGNEVAALTAALGPELSILQDIPDGDIAPHSTLLAEAIRRLRRGEVIREPGFDGEYGVIRLFQPGEVARLREGDNPGLFDATLVAAAEKPAPKPQPRPVSAPPPQSASPVTPQVPAATGSVLDGLDAQQRAAAAVDGGPLLIVAGPGTGKTRTLTYRIAHLVAERGVDPNACLAITFTRRAAGELRERLQALVPRAAPHLTVTTFHSLGLEILRRHPEAAGLSPRFGIADSDVQLAIASQLADSPNQGRALLAEVSRQRRDGTETPQLHEYLKALRAKDLVDFDDLVALPRAMMDADPDLARTWSRRYGWISVDEYQDVDAQQYALLRHLAPPNANLTAIGDPDQAIYRFRGAEVGFFLRFTRDFPSATQVRLDNNYRCGAKVLHAASRLIAPGTLVPERRLRAARDVESTVGVHHAATEQAEASFVARAIEQLLGGASFHSFDSGRVTGDGGGQLGFSDFAVLYRTDRQARAVGEALTRAGFPFQKRSHDRLTERPGVRELLDELAFGTDTAASVLSKLAGAAAALTARHGGGDKATDVHTALELLRPLAEECADDVVRFRAQLALGVDVDTWDPRADRISLLTLHASKGLEFPAVFIVGCEDGLLPLRFGGQTDEAELAEERRLLFVGATRAGQHLYLSHAAARARQGSMTPATRSPFLNDLDADSYERIGATVTRPRTRKASQPRLL